MSKVYVLCGSRPDDDGCDPVIAYVSKQRAEATLAFINNVKAEENAAYEKLDNAYLALPVRSEAERNAWYDSCLATEQEFLEKLRLVHPKLDTRILYCIKEVDQG